MVVHTLGSGMVACLLDGFGRERALEALYTFI